MSGATIPCAPNGLFDGTDIAGFVDGAIDEHQSVPISEGTVQLPKFQLRSQPKPEGVTRTASPPSWLVQLADVVPARYEKALVAGILFFFLFGVLSFLAGVTILLFVL